MPDIYPLPEANQTIGINEIATYVNGVTSGLFFPLILFALFVIIFITTMNFGNGRAFVFASFFCAIISIFMVIARLLNPTFMYLLFVLLAGGLMILRISKSSNLPQI